MQVTNRYEVEGLKELEKALLELGADLGYATLRTAGKKAMEPVLQAAKQGANEDTGDMQKAMAISTKKGRGARGKGGSTAIEILVGATRGTITEEDEEGKKTKRKLSRMNEKVGAQEYGTENQQARPFLRPALANNADRVLSIFGAELSIAIDKAAKKVARQAAKKVKK